MILYENTYTHTHVTH